MLVYGDITRELPAARVAGRIRGLLAQADELAGLARHQTLVEALIEAGALAQAVADASFRDRGEVDALDPATVSTFDLVRAIARMVVASWQGAFHAPDVPAAPALAMLDSLHDVRIPTRVELREPEGFAHYAVYPEAYAAAARLLPPGALCVIGLRSIGTTLAAMVAAAREEVPLALTVRPSGHPFHRTVRLEPALRQQLAALASSCRFAIVDEGPGLSGSSIASVVVALEGCGVPADRIHVLPSHGGDPGGRSSDDVRRAWARVERHIVTFDDLAGSAATGGHRLGEWCADLIGELIERPREIAGGAWRDELHLQGTANAPPAIPWQEKRKFLLRSDRGSYLARFVGLGRTGREKHELALRLAGFVPEVIGLRHGFLIERWHGDARPLILQGPEFLPRLGDYLGKRATLLPPGGMMGASIHGLYAMLLHNAGEILGTDAEAFATTWSRHLTRLSDIRRPISTDSRLHRWEWIDAGGSLLKTDALDHHAGHDLVGPQDISWDVAGAIVEYDLDAESQGTLVDRIATIAGYRVDGDLVRFSTATYCAYQLGLWSMAEDPPDEKGRLDALRERYRAKLVDCLQQDEGFTDMGERA